MMSEERRASRRAYRAARRSRPELPLPTRDGVSPSSVVTPDGDWPTLAAFLFDRFAAVSPEAWLARIEAGDVVDASGAPVTATRAFEPSLRLYYYRALDAEVPVPFEEEVLFQDDLVVAVDKPHFLAVTPTGRYLQHSLLVRLKRRLGTDPLSPIHRIDRETAGVVVFCVRPEHRGLYQTLFAQRLVAKRYEAVTPFIEGLPSTFTRASRLVEHDSILQMIEVPGEPNAQTGFDLVEAAHGLARYALSPVTGRKHQLRVHCAALGMPICNDLIYPVLQPEGSDDFERPLQLLSKSIEFIDPVNGEVRRFESKRSLMAIRAVNERCAASTVQGRYM
ncbi:MAG: pseudouridine synthase [Rhizobacter sp.]|nr:pseudouridine synthase [Rhizobacter sp.]